MNSPDLTRWLLKVRDALAEQDEISATACCVRRTGSIFYQSCSSKRIGIDSSGRTHSRVH